MVVHEDWYCMRTVGSLRPSKLEVWQLPPRLRAQPGAAPKLVRRLRARAAAWSLKSQVPRLHIILRKCNQA